jgi:hypothetical protein
MWLRPGPRPLDAIETTDDAQADTTGASNGPENRQKNRAADRFQKTTLSGRAPV